MIAVILFWAAWGMIVYSYVLFPIILAAIANRFGSSPAEPSPLTTEPLPDNFPKVAMVVAAYNEEAVLTEKLRNTWALDYPADRFSLVVGSDGSADATATILKACHDPRLHAFIFTTRRGKISVLNEIIGNIGTEIDAEIIIMSDANTMFAKDAIKKLVRHFQNPKVGCVSGEISLEQEGGVSGEGLYWKYEGWIKRNEGKLGFLIGCNGGIFALRRELYEPLPSSIIIEDFVMTMKILEKGWRVEFEPEARGVEPPCATSKAEMIRKIRIGAGNFQALTVIPKLLSPRYGLRSFAYWGHKVLRWFVPFFFLIAVLANILLLQQPFYVALLLLQLSGVAISLYSYRTRNPRRLPKWTKPISYFYIMNYAILCGFSRHVRGTQKVTWDKAP
ncbi:glycosyltransferase family 2 protein [Armatimonas rosea]|uniref:Cellulose synthase/poly-beta-1,6-N-acetylglucosamine synthase-like glycosyltransferase n=1 Tax=Armatimonas rosea TaxID=685828 RepID=A0A7W9W936_ARMRO|nr:glycosyltransferase family 2 protein [Armatimonas rosea]MBB6052876.1 cellulose synthase/poly-beta-1,6-N-acetylglucosamine synthase-like glycosyltransferase [Armatimonas rosea]